MRSKITALFLVITVFSLFASTASANSARATNQASPAGPSISPVRLLSEGSLLSSNYGGLVDLEIHNHTDWSVKFWVDGYFMGTLLPHSHTTVTTGSGKTSLSARADCSCGRTVTWNSTYYLYAGYTYPWVLE